MRRIHSRLPREQKLTEPVDHERIIRRGKVALIFAVTPQRVDQLARAGVLRKVRLPGSTRALGFLEKEVRELLVRRQETSAQGVPHA